MTFEKVIIGDAIKDYTTIYALCEWPSMEPRYVGKTIRYMIDRRNQHIRTARAGGQLPVSRWLRKRIPSGGYATVLLEHVPANKDWAARERYWILKYRQEGFRLLNLTDGGEGIPGYKPSQEHRDRIAAANRTGKHFNCEVCGAEFWRKRFAIARGDCRFCSKECYAKSQRGITRSVPADFTKRAAEAAAAKRRAQTHCKRGHPLSGENLFITTSGSRGCKECRKLHKRAYLARNK